MRTLGLLAALLTLGGCASGPQEVPFSDQSSEALNIANQTDLVQNGSKLRDFTPEEIEAAKASLEKNTGSASTTVGVFKILTGDWMGALDVAGGAVAGFAMDDHTSGQSRWIIAVDADNYSNSLEAKKSVQLLIQERSKQLLENKGNRFEEVVLSEQKESTFGGDIPIKTVNTINDIHNVSFGFYKDDYYDNKDSFHLGKSSLITAKKQYISLSKDSLVYGGAENPIPFMLGYVKGYEGEEGYNRFLLDLTEKLPQGFYFYVPSYDKRSITTLKDGYNWDCDDFLCKPVKIYRTHKSVPSIYTQGRRLDFITPQS